MSMSKRIRAAVAHGPLTRDAICTIVGGKRKAIGNLIHRQLKVGLLVETPEGIVAGRVPTFEDAELVARRERERRERGNARKRARRAMAPKPPRAVLTPEEREARYRQRLQDRLARERAARAANPNRRKFYTPEEAKERARVRGREIYRRRAEALKAKGLNARGQPSKARVYVTKAKAAKVKPPGLVDCAKSKPEPVKVVMPATAHLSLEQLRAMGVPCFEYPPPAYSRPRLLPVHGRWVGTRAAA